MYTQVYEVSPHKQVVLPTFLDEGRIFITFVPKGEELYLESDDYHTNTPVFESHSWEEDQEFFNSIS